MDCRCHNSFLLFCRLLVLSERSVASFRRHVAFRFYPLEGLNIATRYHANNFQRDNIVEIFRSGEEGKERYVPLSLPSPMFWLCCKVCLFCPIMIKITIKLPPAYHEIFLPLMLSYRHFLQYAKPTPKNVLDECLSVLFN